MWSNSVYEVPPWPLLQFQSPGSWIELLPSLPQSWSINCETNRLTPCFPCYFWSWLFITVVETLTETIYKSLSHFTKLRFSSLFFDNFMHLYNKFSSCIASLSLIPLIPIFFQRCYSYFYIFPLFLSSLFLCDLLNWEFPGWAQEQGHLQKLQKLISGYTTKKNVFPEMGTWWILSASVRKYVLAQSYASILQIMTASVRSWV